MRKIAVMLAFVLICGVAFADSPNHDGEEYRKYGELAGGVAGGKAGELIGKATGVPGADIVGGAVGEVVGEKVVGHYAERYGNASDSERREMESDAVEIVAPGAGELMKSYHEKGEVSAWGVTKTVIKNMPVIGPTTGPDPVPILKFLWKWW
ncbi:MAG: hypothetical protein IJQ58_02570 [Synergistaceae bacterium]|nr:hypothetical protein [Synergistaceae bacterium]